MIDLTDLNFIRRVWVKTEFVGWHRWPNAPAEREYLALKHRHLFRVIVSIDVEHNDREVEFHDLLDVVRRSCGHLEGMMGPSLLEDMTSSASCEQIAERIIGDVLAFYPDRSIGVSVSEDGEVGATVDVA